jgi:glycolate oxidase iron-sulfur subunit
MRKAGKKSAFVGSNIPSDELLNNCIHCGLCLPVCPTYSITGLERSSPRGRIRLIKSVAEGKLTVSKEFIYEMNYCLDCQACETACPAGIKYGSLVEAARAQIYQGKHASAFVLFIKHILLNWLFSSHRRFKQAARLLRFVQSLGIRLFLNTGKNTKLISKKLHSICSLTPTVSKIFSTDSLAKRILPSSFPRYRVIFFTGCIMDVAFADVNEDTVQLLLHHGCEVIIPKEQKCCGSLQAHNGDITGAKNLARYIIQLFSRYDFDYIVMNSAGCGAYMKDYGKIFETDSAIAENAKIISSKVKDVSEFLEETGFLPANDRNSNPFYGKKVTYHDACHLVHTQHISLQPRKLINAIDGIQYVELPESTWCCGSAGIFNITHFEDSMQILQRKVENIKRANPDILVTGNPGCLIQIQHGLNQAGMKIELLHTATFLRRACGV